MRITQQLLKVNKILTQISLLGPVELSNGGDAIFIFKDGLSLIINRVSFNFSKNILLLRIRIPKSS